MTSRPRALPRMVAGRLERRRAKIKFGDLMGEDDARGVCRWARRMSSALPNASDTALLDSDPGDRNITRVGKLDIDADKIAEPGMGGWASEVYKSPFAVEGDGKLEAAGHLRGRHRCIGLPSPTPTDWDCVSVHPARVRLW